MIPAASVQKLVPGVNRFDNWLALLPTDPVSVICGSLAATATPICALAACSDASAACTSGRCATSFAGRLTGRSTGKVRPDNSNVSLDCSLGGCPASAANRSRCWSNCFCNGGNTCCACASAASCAATSTPAT